MKTHCRKLSNMHWNKSKSGSRDRAKRDAEGMMRMGMTFCGKYIQLAVVGATCNGLHIAAPDSRYAMS
jgi:hypothetical protein